MRYMARPTKFTKALAAEICARIAEAQSLREICRDDKMPGMTTVFRWLADNEEFRKQYAHAREAQADYIAEEILEIADDGSNDWMERQGKEDDAPGYVLNGEAVSRSKLRVDARKWLLSKLAPKKYGDKVQQEISGPDGGALHIEIIRFGDAKD